MNGSRKPLPDERMKQKKHVKQDFRVSGINREIVKINWDVITNGNELQLLTALISLKADTASFHLVANAVTQSTNSYRSKFETVLSILLSSDGLLLELIKYFQCKFTLGSAYFYTFHIYRVGFFVCYLL